MRLPIVSLSELDIQHQMRTGATFAQVKTDWSCRSTPQLRGGDLLRARHHRAAPIAVIRHGQFDAKSFSKKWFMWKVQVSNIELNLV